MLHLLADRLAPADAAISVFRGEAADAKFIDFTLKDLLSRALEREPVGRRGLKASVWHAAVALLSARNALLRTGGQDLIEALGGAEAARAAAQDWCAAAREVVAQLRKWA